MLIAALLAAMIAVYLIQYSIYRRHSFDGIRYSVSLSAAEVFEGEDIFLTEEIVNSAALPLPFVKVDTSLPAGLRYRLIDEERDGSRAGRFVTSVQSIFVLRPHEKVRRTWRVNCHTRGDYTVGCVMIVTNDLIGFNQCARQIAVPRTAHNRIVVLPRTISLAREFVSSRYLSGDISVQRSVVSDPLRPCGVREYTPHDPMNRINWKSTAAHGALMVNIEEFTQRHQFNLVLNMNSRDIEHVPGPPSIPSYIEPCVTVAASILETVAEENIAVRLITNTMPPDADPALSAAANDADAVGREIFVSSPLSGRSDMLSALRLLASLPLHIGVSIEKMLDHIAAHPYRYASGGNLILISAYLSERMIHFARALRQSGCEVLFYITGSSDNTPFIPDDITVCFRIAPSEKEDAA